MRVLLVTLWGNVNIGNRLQHYALQKVLEDIGCEVDNAVYRRQREKRSLTLLKDCVKICLSQLGIYRFQDYSYRRVKANKDRKKKFDKFIAVTVKNQVAIDFDDIDCGKLDYLEDRYSYAITGSDQVWHHWFSKEKNELPYFYLSFISEEKRISYAASFGFSKFPENDIENHKIGLKNIEKLSVRELEMVDMIGSLIGRKVEVVVDPTLLLSKESWRNIETKPNHIYQKKFVVVYFVGNKPDEYVSAIKELTGEIEQKINKKVQIINLYDIDYPDYYSVSPDEFLYLIDNSEFVFTDSFHGTVFSLLYEKNFLVFRRKQFGSEDMYGRLEGLLKQMKITGHEYNSEMLMLPDIPDYENVNIQMNAQRSRSLEWLKQSLSNGEVLD